MDLSNIIGLGVAGNFTDHLEQAGEAQDFINIESAEANQPKGIFPFYVNSPELGYLSAYPLSSNKIIIPAQEEKLQIEPEVAILFDISYDAHQQVNGLTPRLFGAYNDCSIRKPHARKISEKKNWGTSSKGFSATTIALSHLDAPSLLDQYSIASFHKAHNKIEIYGENSMVKNYSYFHKKLIDWLIERMNNQKDTGPLESISSYLSMAKYPTQALISIGATRYTPYGQTHFLKEGDESIVAVYDQNKYSFEKIHDFAQTGQWPLENISTLIQTVSS